MSRKPAPVAGRLVGYARVSTQDQTTALQLDALKAAGCTEIHQDRASGAVVSRPGLDSALASLATGDVLDLDERGRIRAAHLADAVAMLSNEEGR